MTNGMNKGRKGPIEQSTFKDEKQFKVYDGTGKAAGMPAYDELLADTELYWGLGEYDSPKDKDKTVNKTKRPAKEFPTEHQDLFIRLAEHVGNDVLYQWLHQPHNVTMAGLKPGVKPKALPIDCRPPYFDDKKQIVGVDRFAEYLDYLAKGGEWPDAPRLTSSYINFVSKQAEAKEAKETKVETPEPPPKPGPKPIEGPRPPPLPPGPPPQPGQSVFTDIYGFKADVGRVTHQDVELPETEDGRLHLWPIEDFERMLKHLDDTRTRVREEIGNINGRLHDAPASVEVEALIEYIEKEKISETAPEIIRSYLKGEKVKAMTSAKLKKFISDVNIACSSPRHLKESYHSKALESAKSLAKNFKRRTFFGKEVQDTDYTDELVSDIEYAFENPDDADLIFADIRKARIVQHKDGNIAYANALGNLERLQHLIDPEERTDPANPTSPTRVRQLADRLVALADKNFFADSLSDEEIKYLNELHEQLEAELHGAPARYAGLVYRLTDKGMVADELLLVDFNGRKYSITVKGYAEGKAGSDSERKPLNRKLNKALAAVLMLGREIADERMEKVEPAPQDGPLPPLPPYLEPSSPPPGPPGPRYGPKPWPLPPPPKPAALPGPPQDGEDESEFTEVDELEEGDDGKKGFTVPKLSKPADAQDKDIEYECPLCGANVKDEDPKCPECGAEFEKSKDEEGEK
jgi:hypothetical protein